jgi:hypothetical protein
MCPVEGREVALCGPCNAAWRIRAAAEEKLRNRCPLCASAQISVSAGVNPAETTRPVLPVLTGDLADALDAAMFQEGLLVDVRRRVLRRLGADERVRETVLHA